MLPLRSGVWHQEEVGQGCLVFSKEEEEEKREYGKKVANEVARRGQRPSMQES